MSQTKTPQGLLAVVERYHYTMEDLISVMDKRENGNTFLVLESIQDPGNLGTIVRTAEAADVTGIIIGGQSESGTIHNGNDLPCAVCLCG